MSSWLGFSDRQPCNALKFDASGGQFSQGLCEIALSVQSLPIDDQLLEQADLSGASRPIDEALIVI